jgi:acetyltransferase
MAQGARGDLITLIATEAEAPGAVVAVAELACDFERGRGEIGLVVLDDAQRKGIGRLLLRHLLQIAQAVGLPHLHGDMLAENHGMRRLAEALRLPYSSTIEAGEMHIIVRVPNVGVSPIFDFA